MLRHLHKIEFVDFNSFDCIHIPYGSYKAVSKSRISDCFRKVGLKTRIH